MKGVMMAMEAQRRRNESEVRQMINTVEQQQALALKAHQKAEKEKMRQQMLEMQAEDRKAIEEEKMRLAKERREANVRAQEQALQEERRRGEQRMRLADIKAMEIARKREEDKRNNRMHAEEKARQVKDAYERAQMILEDRRRELLEREAETMYRAQRREVQNHARAILKREEEHEREAKRLEALRRAEDTLNHRSKMIQQKLDAKALRVEHMNHQKEDMLRDLQLMRKDMDIQQDRLRKSIDDMRRSGTMKIPEEILKAPYTPRAHVPVFAARAGNGGGSGARPSSAPRSRPSPGNTVESSYAYGGSSSSRGVRPASAERRRVFTRTPPASGGRAEYTSSVGYSTPGSQRARPASATRARTPASARGRGAAGPSPESERREDALRRMLEREDTKERERERILGMVKDPREKQRLHKLFSIERERAKEAILRLSA